MIKFYVGILLFSFLSGLASATLQTWLTIWFATGHEFIWPAVIALTVLAFAFGVGVVIVCSWRKFGIRLESVDFEHGPPW